MFEVNAVSDRDPDVYPTAVQIEGRKLSQQVNKGDTVLGAPSYRACQATVLV